MGCEVTRPVIPPRLPDWRARLDAYVAAAWRRPFGWGDVNCGLFVAGAVEAMTGLDPAAHLRGHLGAGPREARQAIRRSGYRDHVAMVADLLQQCHRAEARVGDVAVVLTGASAPQPMALGLVAGHRVLVMRPVGLGSVGLLDADVTAAYRVP